MDKQTKFLLGLGLVAAGGYLLWKQGQTKKSFASVGRRQLTSFTGNVGPRKLTSFVGAIDGVDQMVGPKELLPFTGNAGDRSALGTGTQFGFTGDAGDRSKLGSGTQFSNAVGAISTPDELAGDKQLLSYVGTVGNRMRADGRKMSRRSMAGGSVEAHQSKFNASGSASAGGFFKVEDSGWPA